MNAHLNPEALEELKRIKNERQEREKRSSGLGEWDAGDDTELPRHAAGCSATSFAADS